MTDRHATRRRGVGVFCLVLAASLSAAPPVAAETKLKAKYVLSLSGLKIGNLRFTGTLDGGRYELDGSGNIAGLPQFFTSFSGETHSSGTIDGQRAEPERHRISYNTVKKDYVTQIRFSDRSVTDLELEPPYKIKKSRVPVLEEHRTNVIDPLSAAIIPMPGDEPLLGPGACDRTLPVFDGRERFDLSLVYKGLGMVKGAADDDYSGAVAICGVDYIPIAGHRRDDDFMDRLAATDAIEIWLAPVETERALVLYRARVPTPFGAAVIFPKAFIIAPIQPQG